MQCCIIEEMEDVLGVHMCAKKTTCDRNEVEATLTEPTHSSSEIDYYKKSVAALYTANKKLNLLISTTRHDILNIMTVIYGSRDLLTDAPFEAVTSERHYNRILEAVDLIEANMAVLGRYQNFGVQAPMWQRLESALRRSAEIVALQDVQLYTHNCQVEILADPLIEKVFSTLLENARRHGGEVSAVIAAFAEEDGVGVITVEDDGDGIRADQKEQIFSPGFGQHTGMGLYFAREILEVTGFSIQEVGEKGRGARFEIRIPSGYYR